MSMVYVGNRTYIDTDELDNEGYAEFCKHMENLEKYYKYKDNESAKIKAKMLGVDIDKILDEARTFLMYAIYGTADEVYISIYHRDEFDIDYNMKCIAYKIEE